MPHRASHAVFGRDRLDATLKHMSKDPAPTIRDLYPNFEERELTEAEDNLDRYLALALRIFERVESDPQADALTAGAGTLGSNSPQVRA